MAAPSQADKSTMMLKYFLLVVLAVHHVCCKSKFVSVSLDAKWKATPILLEASEFLAKESDDFFWHFVHDVASVNPSNLAKETNKSYYEMIQKFARRNLSPVQLNLMKFSMSLRAFSPTVQMYQQLAVEQDLSKSCDTFVDVQGEQTCDLSEISSLLKTAEQRSPPEVFTFDHSYPGTSQYTTVVILYGELGSQGFLDFHKKILELTPTGSFRYIIRHFIQKPSENSLKLSGYGVELAIKSTEYKAKDDTKVEATFQQVSSCRSKKN